LVVVVAIVVMVVVEAAEVEDGGGGGGVMVVVAESMVVVGGWVGAYLNATLEKYTPSPPSAHPLSVADDSRVDVLLCKGVRERIE
jgi:hypothetical protein